MIISVVNHSGVSDQEVQRVIRAVNRQIHDDFRPYWSMSAELRLEGRGGKRPHIGLPELRGDAIIYLWDKIAPDDAEGFHDKNAEGIPDGYVYRALSEELGEDWSVTLSHEALELIGDPTTNLYCLGPRPDDHRRHVLHWFEMCDAVQDQVYEIDGVKVSNFVLPLYFTNQDEPGNRNDFLGVPNPRTGEPLHSFGVSVGGYIGFYDPHSQENVTYELPGDKRSLARAKIKRQAGHTRRAIRYQQGLKSATRANNRPARRKK